MRIQGDTRFPFTQKEHMVDTGTGSPQASSTYSMEAYFSASTSIKVAGIKGWHSTSVLTRFGHQKCKLSLLLQWRKCNREATRRPISYDVKSLILQTHVSELTLCDLEQGHLRLIGWLFEESSAQTDDWRTGRPASQILSIGKLSKQEHSKRLVLLRAGHPISSSEDDRTILSQKYLQRQTRSSLVLWGTWFALVLRTASSCFLP